VPSVSLITLPLRSPALLLSPVELTRDGKGNPRAIDPDGDLGIVLLGDQVDDLQHLIRRPLMVSGMTEPSGVYAPVASVQNHVGATPLDLDINPDGEAVPGAHVGHNSHLKF